LSKSARRGIGRRICPNPGGGFEQTDLRFAGGVRVAPGGVYAPRGLVRIHQFAKPRIFCFDESTVCVLARCLLRFWNRHRAVNSKEIA
jgi:hypothetical protein